MHFHTSKARKIGVMNRSVSGVVPDIGAYESTLERDFMELMRFDPLFHKITPQPLTFDFVDKEGKKRSYTPDGLLHFHSASGICPVLYEIKYREDFRGAWRSLLPKFRAAKKLASGRGWEFKVFTEVEIRTPYLENVKFLWPYKNTEVQPADRQLVLSTLVNLGSSNPLSIVKQLASSELTQARYLSVLWHLIANFAIKCDLEVPITMTTEIAFLEEHNEVL